jgi:hypothetical protein
VPPQGMSEGVSPPPVLEARGPSSRRRSSGGVELTPSQRHPNINDRLREKQKERFEHHESVLTGPHTRILPCSAV